jgi:anti-sigma regulatory factor (Ser/Thr protein kinase)
MNELAARGPFRHAALLYPDDEMYVHATSVFIREGLAAGEPVLVAVPAANLAKICGAMRGDTDGVRFLDMQQVGRNPNRIIPWVLRAFLIEHAPRQARIICEPIWPGRSPEEVPLAIQHDALINRAFGGRDATILCPYDATRLDTSLLSFATRTHPFVCNANSDGSGCGDLTRPCAAYTDPDMVIAALNQPLPDASESDAGLTFDLRGLHEVRELIQEHATCAGLSAGRIADLQLAVNEVATNTLLHGAGPGTLKIWYQPDRLICEIQGPGEISDWLAGRMIPAEDTPRGRGLLVANLLCDLVEAHTHPFSTTTRLHMRYP